MKLSDFDYDLPPELIAQTPAAERADSRLLYLDGRAGQWEDRRFRDLGEFFEAGDVLVFNDTRVIKARLLGKKASGGRIEVLVERVLSANEAHVQIRSSRSPTAGTVLRLGEDVTATVLGRHGPFFHVRFEGCDDLFALLEREGSLPLPPYITHAPDADDATRYQTVYAREPGAVAAPTAGLHFDEAMLETLRRGGVHIAFVTLHVGAGTFQPVRVDNVAEHEMHSEWFNIPGPTVEAISQARSEGRRVTAVGTTSLRALETAAVNGLSAGPGESKLFIYPGFDFKVVDRLITNFHLPRSTLLMLVSAFAGFDLIRAAYRHAVEQRYRFFSYGDAMLIDRAAVRP